MPTKALIPLPVELDPAIDTCIQFVIPGDVQWRAMFWGALDQLTRWNSYERDFAIPRGLAVANIWKQIVADARATVDPGVGCPDACPSALMYIDVIPGITQGYDQFENSWYVETCHDPCEAGNPFIHVGWAEIRGLSLRCEASLTFRDVSYNLVGTHICEIRAERIGGFATWNFTLKWESCDGFVHTETFQNPPHSSLFKQNFEAKWIWIDCNAKFFWSLTFDGPILCGPA